MLPVVQQLVALCNDGLGEWCHWGATTQDITDSATIMQIREALALVEQEINGIADALAALREKAPRHADGRTQQSAAGGADHLRLQDGDAAGRVRRHRQRLKEMRARVLVGEFGGAAGTLASLGKRGLEVQAELMKELKLGQPAIAWHTVRDCIAEIGCFLGLVTGTCGKIAFDVKLMMQTEVEEALRAVPQGRGSSSTMPQKRNPISSVYITALTAVVRQQVAALLNAMEEDHERATGPWEIEWIVLPEIFCLAAGALAQTRFVLAGLQVDEKRMRANLDITKGLIVSEAVMMGLGPHLGRQYAHDLVYDICRKVSRPAAAGRSAGGERRDHEAPRPRRAGQAVRSGELSRRRRARWWIACWRCEGGKSASPRYCGERKNSLHRRRRLRRGLLRHELLQGQEIGLAGAEHRHLVEHNDFPREHQFGGVLAA